MTAVSLQRIGKSICSICNVGLKGLLITTPFPVLSCHTSQQQTLRGSTKRHGEQMPKLPDARLPIQARGCRRRAREIVLGCAAYAALPEIGRYLRGAQVARGACAAQRAINLKERLDWPWPVRSASDVAVAAKNGTSSRLPAHTCAPCGVAAVVRKSCSYVPCAEGLGIRMARIIS